MTNSAVESVDTSGDKVKATVKTKKGEEVLEADVVLSAVGIAANIENIGLEDVGIVTDKDLRRRVLAEGRDTEQPISGVMTPDPSALPAHADLDDALLTMMRRGYHHLPVIEHGRPVGLVTAGDLLRAQSEHPLRLLQDIQRQSDLDGLVSVSQRLPSLFVRMMRLGRDVEQVGRLITQVTDAFTLRLIALAEADLGPAPQAWAWLAFGSQARQEQTARTDQDNGLVTERAITPDEAPWFDQLSRRVCDGLDRLGALCSR